MKIAWRVMQKVRLLRQRTIWKWWTWQFQRRCLSAGKNTVIMGPVRIYGGGRVRIGDNLVVRSRLFNQVEIFVGADAALDLGSNVFINQGVRIACSKGVTIGSGCQIGDECVILDNDYHAAGRGEVKREQVCLEKNFWLATRVIVLRGVTIGEGSVIGAGSVVTRSIPPGCFAAGVPTRVLKPIS